MPGALSSEFTAWSGTGWRLVEAQHRTGTLKLVDSLTEQALLDALLDATKPPVPPEARGLDPHLAAPFRYAATNPNGSRFRRPGQTPGVFYAAERVETAIAEIAFYRMLFFAESPATPFPENPLPFTAFSVAVATDCALDLTDPAFDARREALMALADYTASQAFADEARAAGARLVRHLSVRDPGKRGTLALLSPHAFAAPAPLEEAFWQIKVGPKGVLALGPKPADRLDLPLRLFAADPRLAPLL